MRHHESRSRRVIVPMLLALSVLLPGATAFAQNQYYVGGSVGFHYQQFPFGAYRGDFAVTGTVLPGPVIPGESFTTVGGFLRATADTTTAWWYAAVAQPDTTVDLAVLWVRKPGAPAAGSYPIDVVGRSVLFGYAEGISDFNLPADPTTVDPAAWLDGLVCEHLFLALNGTVRIDAINALSWSGGFSGLAADAGLLAISISSGAYALDGLDVAVEQRSWGDLKACFR